MSVGTGCARHSAAKSLAAVVYVSMVSWSTSASGDQVDAVNVRSIRTGLRKVLAAGDASTAERASSRSASGNTASYRTIALKHASLSHLSMVTSTVPSGSVVPALSAAISMDMQMQAASALSSSSCGRMPEALTDWVRR